TAINTSSSTSAGYTLSRLKSWQEPVYTVSDGTLTSAYVFTSSASDGFVILSADDVASPILGYADSGTFDPNNIPPNMAEWLNEYTRQIAYATASGHTRAALPDTPAPDRAPIGPLCQTLWDQTWPYNLECPVVGSAAAPTGCVATAMAQVMYYHQWPKDGTFDWDNMLLSYETNGNSTEAQNTAVAHLMRSCGESVSMSYGASASGANTSAVATALIGDYNYSQSVCCVPGNVFNIRQWEDLIYNQLVEFGPVVYSGRPENGTSGHCFVVDGYDRNHYFHVNWGWSGLSNGYFLLTALNPSLQGTGGSDYGYTTGHQAILGVQPNTASAKPFYTMWAARYTLGFAKTAEGNPAFAMTNNIVIANYSGLDIKQCYFGVTAENTETGVITDIFSDEGLEFPSLRYMYPIGYKIPIPLDLANGVYKLRPAFRVNADGKAQLMSTGPNCYMSSMTFTKKGPTDLTIQYNPTLDAAIAINDLNVNSHIYPNHTYNLAVNLTNITDIDFAGSIGTEFFPPGDSQVTIADIKIWGAFNNIIIPAGETVTVNLTPYCDLTATPGKYRLGILSEDMNVIGDLIEVEIMANPTSSTYTLRCNDVVIEDADNVDPNNIKISGNLLCEAGNFTGLIGFGIYDQLSKEFMGSIRMTDNLTLAKGASSQVNVNGSVSSLTGGMSYIAIPASFIGADITNIPSDYGLRSYKFTVSSTSGIDAVESANADVIAVEIYDLTGRRLSAAPEKGIYIRRVIKSDGTTEVYKDLK
ncbi:MAG: C10 family peptidase, partial [Muribaculaceae bacterium]|nr:C10 family peptidase [Muribaculaceae bacterium]